jgi:1,4-dihydroxy-6-naphthoate synthase
MEPRTLTLGHSPDPDDAFMFYALAAEKIETRGWRFQHVLQDIQTLNERATRGELDITAISIHAYASVLDQYALLSCGASMGDGYGPMLVAPRGIPVPSEDELRAWLRAQRIAIPGRMTSAFLALQLFLGEKIDAVVVPFDEIFSFVAQGRAEVGLIIHEGQLTFAAEGFIALLDLGAWWKRETRLPLPLGGNVIHKRFPCDAAREINEILRESIRFGLAHRRDGIKHAMPLARGLDVQLADKFIGMYVNHFTLDYGDIGRRAIRVFLGRAHAAGLIKAPVELEFVE